jgi:hypothetical protein
MNPFPFPNDPSQNEPSSLATLNAEEQALQARLVFFSTSSGGASSEQIHGYIEELNTFLGRFLAYRATANDLLSSGRPAYSQKLDWLIQSVQYNISTYKFTYRSRLAFEQAMGRPPFQTLPPPSAADPGPGSPEWFMAVMGKRCYHCGQDLIGLPYPVKICPRCGRFPTPP